MLIPEGLSSPLVGGVSDGDPWANIGGIVAQASRLCGSPARRRCHEIASYIPIADGVASYSTVVKSSAAGKVDLKRKVSLKRRVATAEKLSGTGTSSPAELSSALVKMRYLRALAKRLMAIERLEDRRLLAVVPLLPVAGDWDADGSAEVGLFDSPSADLFLRRQNSPGFADVAIDWGAAVAGQQALLADWNGDGTDTPGFYDEPRGVFTQKASLDPAAVDRVLRFGLPDNGGLAIAGDWDGDASDGVGLYNPAGGSFSLRNDNNATNVSSAWQSVTTPSVLTLSAPLLSLTSTSPTEARLDWDSVLGATGYHVYRYLAGRSTFVETVGSNITSYTLGGLTAGETHHFLVQSVGPTGTVNSNWASISPALAPLSLAAPTLAASVAAPTQIDLTWNDTAGEDGYYVYTYTGGRSQWIATLGPNETSYSVTGLPIDATHNFLVQSFDAGGRHNSNWVSVATPANVPLLSIAATSTTQAELSWTDTAGETAYYIYRYGQSGSSYLATVGQNVTSYTAGGLAPGSTHFFLIVAVDVPTASDISFQFGAGGANLLPVSGDWNGDGSDTVGLYDPASGMFSLAEANTSGTSVNTFQFGPIGSSVLPVAGDWNGDGADAVGVYDPTTGMFHLAAGNLAGAADNAFLVAPAVDTTQTAVAPQGGLAPLALPQLSAAEVTALLRRAAAASASEDAIIAVVDRGGHILGVRAEAGVLAAIPNTDTLVFAIDGAVAKARTAAFFSNGDPTNGTLAPLTSRTIRFLSQSTITQREVESNPNSAVATIRGPGFVAPIGLGGHFPPEINFTPPVDLFAIEHTNRDSIVHPGPDFVRDTITLNAAGDVTSVSGDDILLASRFNANPAFIPGGQEIDAPESYGFVSGRLPNAQSRGIATLPGGIPLFRDTNADGLGDTLIGGIGVFFPGTDGYATHEQGFVAGIGQTEKERTNAARVLEAEWIAFAAAGGSAGAGVSVGEIGGEPALANFDLPFGRIDLVGIQVEVYGPHPTTENTLMGVMQLPLIGAALGTGSAASGADQPINVPGTQFYADGEAVPEGWLVLPHSSGIDPITAADVTAIVTDAIAEANLVRAAIRLPLSSRTRMVLAVTDTSGEVLGLFRMKDATFFSLDVAVAKARNTAYYADAGAIVDADRVDADLNGLPDANVPAGTAFTNRTFRFLAEARFPDGIDGSPGPFSILNDPGTDPLTAENTGAPAAASDHTSVLGFDAFNPGSNFRDPDNVANQNGVVFFPGSTPLYQGGVLVGGFGVSGDGVDQDDVVTFFGADMFLPPNAILRADEVFVRTVRLPFMKFLRNPEG